MQYMKLLQQNEWTDALIFSSSSNHNCNQSIDILHEKSYLGYVLMWRKHCRPNEQKTSTVGHIFALKWIQLFAIQWWNNYDKLPFLVWLWEGPSKVFCSFIRVPGPKKFEKRCCKPPQLLYSQTSGRRAARRAHRGHHHVLSETRQPHPPEVTLG